jgi:hypothetical protein
MNGTLVGMVRDQLEGKNVLPIMADLLDEIGDERAEQVRDGNFFLHHFSTELGAIWDADSAKAKEDAFRKATKVEAGKWVEPDGWKRGNSLVADESGFCDFRLPSDNYATVACAVRIHVTGRTLQRGLYKQRVRVKIEFLKDGEPSTFQGGWMYVN